MQVWNVLHAARWKYRTQKFAKIRHLRTIAHLCRAVPSPRRHISTIAKNLLNSNISSTCPDNTVNFGPLTAEINWRVWGTPANFNGFVYWLRYCTDVAKRRSTKLCTMFGGLLDWYKLYTFSRDLAPNGIFVRCKIHFASKSFVLLYWQRYCTALEHYTSGKLCGVGQGKELRNFRSLFAPTIYIR